MKMLDRFLNTEYTYARADLGIYRILFCFVVLSELPFASWLADLPAFMFSPPISPVALFHGFPPVYVYNMINVVTAASALMLLFGLMPKTTSLVLACSMLSIRAFAYASGKINHDILLPLIPVVLAFSNWGAAFRITNKPYPTSKQPDEDGFPIAIFAFLIAFWIATAGWQKLTTGWLSLSYSAVYQDVFTMINVNGRHAVVGQFAISTLPNVVWEFGDWMTVAFELSGLLLVWKRSTFYMWLFAASFFHLAIDLFMTIRYLAALVAYGVFVPWTQLPIVSSVLHASKPRLSACLIALILIVLTKTVPLVPMGRLLVWIAPVIALTLVRRLRGEDGSRVERSRI